MGNSNSLELEDFFVVKGLYSFGIECVAKS
jgi:hypothetical protein